MLLSIPLIVIILIFAIMKLFSSAVMIKPEIFFPIIYVLLGILVFFISDKDVRFIMMPLYVIFACIGIGGLSRDKS